MYSTTFPFFVGAPDPQTKRIALTDAEFRFTTKAGRLLERACGGNIDNVLARGKAVEAVVLLVCYGLIWTDPAMTEDKAADLIDEFIDAGGNVTELSAALYLALAQSGIYGPVVLKKGKAKKADPTSAPAAA